MYKSKTKWQSKVQNKVETEKELLAERHSRQSPNLLILHSLYERKQQMERLIIPLVILILVLVRYFGRRLGEAYCAAANYAPTLELRREFSRKAVLAGNREARKIFPITIARIVADHQPLKVFKRKKIPCIFTDYYFPSRYNPYLSEAQKQFCQSILDFKDGKHDGIRFLVAGIEGLKPKPGTVVMFMPCSTQRKYWKRFKAMADYVHDEYPELVCGISYVRYTGERERLHLQKGRENVELEKNYFFKEDLAGKEVLVVDDILTTGKSLQDFRKEVEADGGKVVGAIFAAETFKMPGAIWCYLGALGWSEDDAKKLEPMPAETNMDNPCQRRKRGIYDEEPEDIDWIPDRTIIHGNSVINLWYGKRKGKQVVVKKQVLPLDPDSDGPCSDDLSEFDLPK